VCDWFVEAMRNLSMLRLSALTLLCIMIASCASVPRKLVGLPAFPESSTTSSMKVPYPILLLHGLGQKADVWHGEATTYFKKDLGLRYGGDLKVNARGGLQRSLAGSGDADLYTVQFRNPVDSVRAWTTELDACIDYVRSVTGADRVILIGYSMGGLAARAYLVDHVRDHHVKRLITIGTPHDGSPYARVWNWKTSLKRCVDEQNVVLAQPCKAALAALTSVEGDVPFDAPAVRDLRRPEDDGAFLATLNKRAHPLDVEYVSVIGDVDVVDGVKKLDPQALQEVLRKVLSFFGGSVSDLFDDGDGIVSTRSQDMMNIAYFKADPSRRRTSRVVNISTLHVSHLARNSDVQRASLDERASIVAARVCVRNGAPVMLVDVADHIPLQCSVTIDLKGSQSLRFVAPRGSSTMVRDHDQLVARYVVPLQGIDVEAKQTFTFGVVVTNSFGYVTSTTVVW
jgi:triacylglycerol esterase/lipase EstA (alpha/beta hydrolase family)